MFFKKRKPVNRRVKTKPKLYRMKRSVFDWAKLLLLIGASSFVVLGGIRFLSKIQFFTLKRVDVVASTPHLSKEQIIALAAIPYGANLFSVNLEDIATRIKRYSWVKDVQAKRLFPQGLSLQVEEYTPLAILDIGDLYYVSHEGRIFRKLNDSDDRHYPVVSGFKKEALEKYPTFFGKKIEDTLDFLNRLTPQMKDAGLSRIHFDVAEGFTVFTQNPPMELFFGPEDPDQPSHWQEKLKAFSRLEQEMKNQGVVYQKVDLHVIGKIFVRKDFSENS